MAAITDSLCIVNTSNQSWAVMHDAAQPFAIAELNARPGRGVQRVISRHASMSAARRALAQKRRLAKTADVMRRLSFQRIEPESTFEYAVLLDGKRDRPRV
jgi:hypothetical protein